jgi:hypothetical protein
MRALSIRQPHAEAIMRRVKKIEYRSRQTNIRGTVYIYASRMRFSAESEAKLMRRYRIRGDSCDKLPRGVLIGTVELYDCDGGEWMLRKPKRLARPRRPKNRPQPVWFNPF